MERSVAPYENFSRKGDPNFKYSVCEVLGEGSYGTVYRGISIASKEEFAIKILPFELDGENQSNIEKEIVILKNLRSPYVVSFHESYIFNNEMWIVMECCRGGSLIDLIEITNFQEEEIRAVMAYCCLGLSYLHSKKCIHRDIKSGNILLTLTGKAKIADFGVSAQLSSSMMQRKTVIGSPFWMAPEMIGESSYDGKADIWSLGITLYELCTGRPPHYSVSPLRAIFLISSKPAPKLPYKRSIEESNKPDNNTNSESDWSLDLRDFIDRCLKKESSKRSSADELLHHPFISDYVNLIEKSEKTPRTCYDSDSSVDLDEALGLSILVDLVEDNLPALNEMHRGKQKNRTMRGDHTMDKKIESSKQESSAATMRVNIEEPYSPKSLAAQLRGNKERRPSVDWTGTFRGSNQGTRHSSLQSAGNENPNHGDQRANQDDDWMYGGEMDCSASVSLHSTFVRKVDAIDLNTTFQAVGKGFSGPMMSPLTLENLTPRGDGASSKNYNIQSAVRCLQESEDAKTPARGVSGCLPPLLAPESTTPRGSPRGSLMVRRESRQRGGMSDRRDPSKKDPSRADSEEEARPENCSMLRESSKRGSMLREGSRRDPSVRDLNQTRDRDRGSAEREEEARPENCSMLRESSKRGSMLREGSRRDPSVRDLNQTRDRDRGSAEREEEARPENCSMLRESSKRGSMLREGSRRDPSVRDLNQTRDRDRDRGIAEREEEARPENCSMLRESSKRGSMLREGSRRDPSVRDLNQTRDRDRDRGSAEREEEARPENCSMLRESSKRGSMLREGSRRDPSVRDLNQTRDRDRDRGSAEREEDRKTGFSGLFAQEGEKQRPSMLLTIDTALRPNPLLDPLQPLNLEPADKSIAEPCSRVQHSASSQSGEEHKESPLTVHEIRSLMYELEIEHKTSVFELEQAYEAKRRKLLRKLRAAEGAV